MTVKLDTTRFKGMAEEIKGLVAQETAVEKQILEFRNALKKLANQSVDVVKQTYPQILWFWSSFSAKKGKKTQN